MRGCVRPRSARTKPRNGDDHADPADGGGGDVVGDARGQVDRPGEQDEADDEQDNRDADSHGCLPSGRAPCPRHVPRAHVHKRLDLLGSDREISENGEISCVGAMSLSGDDVLNPHNGISRGKGLHVDNTHARAHGRSVRDHRDGSGRGARRRTGRGRERETAVASAASHTPSLRSTQHGSQRPTVVTLLTGDRVVIRHEAMGRTIASLTPRSPHYGRPVHFVNTGTHTWVVPKLAPAARTRLDPSLFDVAALAHATRVPLKVTFAKGTAPRSLPGLQVRTSSARSTAGGRSTVTASYDARRPLPASSRRRCVASHTSRWLARRLSSPRRTSSTHSRSTPPARRGTHCRAARPS